MKQMADIIYLDPSFPLPDGMDPRVWSNLPVEGETDGDALEETDGEDDFTDVGSDIEIVDDEDDSAADDSIEAPDNLTIVAQTLRRAADGSIVVDVVVDVEDVYGVTKYEFRVTKI